MTDIRFPTDGRFTTASQRVSSDYPSRALVGADWRYDYPTVHRRLLADDPLSVKSLRRYHDLGLLEPADIDPDTGYRYYEVPQVRSARRYAGSGTSTCLSNNSRRCFTPPMLPFETS